MLRGQSRGWKLVLPHGRGRLEPMPFDQPGGVVALPKDEQCLTELLDGVEGAHPEQVLFQGPDEALGAAVPLRGPVAKFWRLRLLEHAGGMSPSEPEVARDPERPCRAAEPFG